MCAGDGQAAARQRAEPARELTGVGSRTFAPLTPAPRAGGCERARAQEQTSNRFSQATRPGWREVGWRRAATLARRGALARGRAWLLPAGERTRKPIKPDHFSRR